MKTLLLSLTAALLLATCVTAAPLVTRFDDDHREHKSGHGHDKGHKDDKRYGYSKKDKAKKGHYHSHEDRRDENQCQHDGRYSRQDQNRRHDQDGNRRREPVPVLRRFPGGILGQ